jgi:hypothetical protein
MPKALFLILYCLFISSGSYAQYVMEEKDHVHDYTFPKSDVYNTLRWTKKDILKGREYDLYSQMDSGFVIIHEYVMMSCRPCITAGKGLEKIVNSMRKLHPGRIKYFQTVFEDETDAATMKKWVKENGFTPDAVFIKGAKEVEFYGGMGMPTILVLGGGKRHKGYYKRLGYSPRDNGVIIKAVRRALNMSVSKYEGGK